MVRQTTARAGYRVTRRFSGVDLVLVTAATSGVVVLGGLAERTFGWGNLIVIGVLVPPVMRIYFAARTALMLTADGVMVGRELVRWHLVGELVVLGSASGGEIEVGVRRRPGDHELVARGTVPRSKYDPAALRAAFELLAPTTAALSGQGLEALGSGTTPVAGSFSRGRRSDLELALRRWQAAHSGWLRWVVAATVVLVVAVAVGVVQIVRQVEPVDADFVGAYPRGSFAEVDEAEPVFGEQANLIGPHFDLAVNQIAIVDSLSAADAADGSASNRPPGRLQAPDGHELIVAHLAEADIDTLDDMFDRIEPGEDPLLYDADHESDLDAWVSVGHGRRELRAFPEPEGVIVVSVREGADAELVVEDEGRSQSISLRTGERQEALGGFYERAGQQVDHQYVEPASFYRRTGPLSVTTEETTVELSIGDASREPWHPDLGYPDFGRAWLRVTWEMEPMVQLTNLGIDARAAIVLVDDAGQRIPAEESFTNPLVVRGGSLVFDVPDTFTTGTLHIGPASGAEPQYPYAWQTPPPDATVALDLSGSPS